MCANRTVKKPHKFKLRIAPIVVGYDKRNENESLSARVGKSIQHAYRMVTFLQTIKIAFSISQYYLQLHDQFPFASAIDAQFVQDVEALYHEHYPQEFMKDNPKPFMISKDSTSRAIDVISCNMRQFLLLFDGTHAPRLSAIGRQIVVVAPDHHAPMTSASATHRNKKIPSKRKQIS